jgi:glycosyltransferase involved in cell wall biosynthesis
LGLAAHVVQKPWKLKESIIHFGDRYVYLDGPFRKIHPSNHVFLTWFHGDPGDPNPEMQRLFSVLPVAVEPVQKVVVTCRTSERVLLDLGIPETKIAKIPLGVDLGRFRIPYREEKRRARADLGIPEGAVCLGSFQKDGSGWGEGIEPKMVKGPDIFLEVIANLSKRFTDLVVLLTGPARGYVKQGLTKLGVRYIHHFLSDYHDIVRYYHAIDLYIVTSRCEGGPKALLECWATGVPIVSTEVGMAADMIRHGQNGMLAQNEDVQSLTNHVFALLEDEVLRNKCSGQALKEVEAYSWPMIAERYYRELYQPLMRQE